MTLGVRALQGRTTRFTKTAGLLCAGYRFPQLAGAWSPQKTLLGERGEHVPGWAVPGAQGLPTARVRVGVGVGEGDRETMTQLGLPIPGPQESTADFPVPISSTERGRGSLFWATRFQGYRRGQNELKGHREERHENVGRVKRQRAMWSRGGEGLLPKGPAHPSLSWESHLAAFSFSVED